MTIVRLRWSGSRLGDPGEELLVEDDGTAWLWSTAPAATSRIARAGTYRTAIDPGLLARLVAGLERDAGAVPAAGRPAVEVLIGDDERRHAVSLDDRGAGGELTRTLAAVRDATLADPAAVVEVSWRPVGRLVESNPATLVVSFTSVGSEAVAMAARGNDVRFVREDGVDWFVPDDGGELDLVGPAGELLGGRIGPARLEPGARASHAFVGVPVPPPPGAVRVHVLFGGAIALIGPAPRTVDPADLALMGAPPGEPDRPVAIASAAVEVLVEPRA